MRKETNPDVVHAYGVWALRIVLAIGAIAGGLLDNTGVVTGCVIGLVYTIIFL